MFTSTVFTAVLASSAVLLSNAVVTPNAPGPGDSFNQGTKCSLSWAGDTESTTAWANMAIELMTGKNEAMVHVTTVATGQDGTKDGTFSYDCPEVTPNSPIYFYQFTSGGTPVVAWTTRFTIAAADGSSTPATLKETDGSGALYGTGALVDPSTAVAPPTFNTTGGSSAGSSASSAGNSGSSAGNTGSSASLPPSVPSSGSSGSTKPSSTGAQTSPPANSKVASVSGSAPNPSASGAAVALGAIDQRMWPFAAALTACAMAFMILL
ncbi:hypothetical protein DFH08DRAFT_853402 [Mycena albidolilacea]|uniref:Yeast cell wall synthesis Kre9/Knh1-like N-terminal domain-containing protein n=1 Tax=Mycena albidolilacea TaxID=1033008 RepID=A0AAD7ADM1_9AGAR|nr:hypothetical protein DFH08DRAFT_853402 [Mycena albidolilacea]